MKCKNKFCREQPQYNSKLSKTFKKVGKKIDITFGSGQLHGIMNKDTVYFNGLEIPDQTLNEITKDKEKIFEDAHFSGIVGLAFNEIGEKGDIPLLDNIKRQHLIEHDVISFYYGIDPKLQDSVMTIGGIDPSLAAGPIKYYPIDGRNFWSLKAEKILVGGKDLNLCGKKGCKLLFDTGTSLMTIPPKDMGKVMEHVTTDDCANFAEMPTFTYFSPSHS